VPRPVAADRHLPVAVWSQLLKARQVAVQVAVFLFQIEWQDIGYSHEITPYGKLN
jgi:hypothetical protein